MSSSGQKSKEQSSSSHDASNDSGYDNQPETGSVLKDAQTEDRKTLADHIEELCQDIKTIMTTVATTDSRLSVIKEELKISVKNDRDNELCFDKLTKDLPIPNMDALVRFEEALCDLGYYRIFIKYLRLIGMGKKTLGDYTRELLKHVVSREFLPYLKSSDERFILHKSELLKAVTDAANKSFRCCTDEDCLSIVESQIGSARTYDIKKAKEMAQKDKKMAQKAKTSNPAPLSETSEEE